MQVVDFHDISRYLRIFLMLFFGTLGEMARHALGRRALSSVLVKRSLTGILDQLWACRTGRQGESSVRKQF
jgi:hypothetical protein